MPETDERVPRHTAPHVNRKLRESTLDSLRRFAGADRAVIDRRIAQLREEWDVERTLETNAAAVSLAGLALGIAVDRRWLALPIVVAGFLLQHALVALLRQPRESAILLLQLAKKVLVVDKYLVGRPVKPAIRKRA